MRTDTVLSEDKVYRYKLGRRWSEGSDALVTFVMLNPSTADAELDDPTIRRCIGFAKGWGYGGLLVVNLYAYRATQPVDLWRAADPVGPQNDGYLREALEVAGIRQEPVIAAWGANARPDRVRQVLAMPWADRLMALKVTKSGAPGHPLYLRSDAQPERWSA